MSTEGILQQFDYKLIGQVGAKCSERYLYKASGLNYVKTTGFWGSCRLIPNLRYRFDQSQTLATSSVGQFSIEFEVFLGPTSTQILIWLRLVSEKIIFGLKKCNDFPTLSCVTVKPLIIFRARVHVYNYKNTLMNKYHSNVFPYLSMQTYFGSSTFQQ